MSRRKVFTDIVECVRWMLEKPGERWVVAKKNPDVACKGRSEFGLHIPLAQVYGPWTAVRDEHGDIPEEVPLPELDAELVNYLKENGFDPDNTKAFQLAIAQAVRMSKEEKR